MVQFAHFRHDFLKDSFASGLLKYHDAINITNDEEDILKKRGAKFKCLKKKENIKSVKKLPNWRCVYLR